MFKIQRANGDIYNKGAFQRCPISATPFIIYIAALITTYARKLPVKILNDRPTMMVRNRKAEFEWGGNRNSIDHERKAIENPK